MMLYLKMCMFLLKICLVKSDRDSRLLWIPWTWQDLLMEEAIAYAKLRKTFGKPIIANQAIQFKLADMDIKIETARNSVVGCLNNYYAGVPYAREAAIAKCYAADISVECALEAIQILGGYGYSREYPVEKLLRDAKMKDCCYNESGVIAAVFCCCEGIATDC